MECPDERTLAILAEGTGPGGRLTLARHLDSCSSCRQTVASLVRLAYGPTLSPAAAGAPGNDVGLSSGQVVADRYRLTHVIGEGGLGIVWAAIDRTTEQPVALKVLKLRYPELDRRFLREVRVAGIIDHPNVAGLHDVVQIDGDGALAMVMDLLEGEPLDRHLEDRGRLSLEETLRIMQPVLSALAAAHGLGIVHRDLKPQNIFLAQDPSGVVRPVLLDFGLAKLTATEGIAAQTSVLTRERQLLGTPHYMAPEQLYGELDIDARTDVWAAGAVLFECLAGRRPLEGSSVGQLMRALATREIPRLRALAPAVPEAFATVVDAMLTRERATRPTGLAPVLAAAASLVAQ